ncbi:MAG: protein kinase [Gemmatimonadales bacterium]|jgi:serine/threonine protein kinase/Flp pilus assembly protein TadD|nr:protein kinase [Gemmatimonadales bacterium]
MADSVDPIGPLRAALAGRYEIEREIGQGAFATVYLARDSRHDRKLALKVLNADPSSETGELRFIREIRMLARLQHPNILPLHDSGHVEAFLYYLMPYVSGETLRVKMSRERHLPIDAATRISTEAADALSYAHGQGIIHRDIKPENILLSGGHAIVADFGIARAIDVAGVQQLTRTGMGGPGTPAYMSPEQLMGDRQLDGRSDIYSLGCVLYEMLTGKPPFAGKEGFVKRFTEPAPRPSVIRKEVPGWLDDVVAKALARDADERFGRAEDLVRALTDHVLTGPRPIAASTTRGSTVSEKTTSGRTSSGRRKTDSRAAVEPIAYRLAPTAENRVHESEQPSIAVLPFANMSENPENEYFSDGITEEILNALSRIPALKVAARTSTFALKGKSLNITEIGQLLNVKSVLEGSVRRMGNRVRISAQLINARDGYHIWSERYDREIEDVFAIQDEIARTIVNRLKVKLTAAQDQALGKRHTDNVEAYELYLRGRHCWYRWNIKGMLEKAIGHYQHALGKDPNYALAYHGLADAYSVPGLWGFQPPSAALPRALAAATRAVELAPDLAESRTSLGFVQLLSLDWEAAESSLLHAIDVNPRHALAHSFHAWLLSIVDRQREAAEAARLGQELDPLSPATNGIAALVSYHGRQYDQAISECQRALERDKSSFLALLAMTLSYAAKGLYKDAISHAERGLSLSPEVNLLRALLAVVYAMAGERQSAERVLAELLERSQREYVGPTMVSWVYANMDQPDSAFEWLAKASSARDCTLGFGIRVPVYDRISGDPRFQELLAGLGLA